MKSPDIRVHFFTGIEFIRISSGSFIYGSADNDQMAEDDEKPQRKIDLPEFWIGRAPITNAQFARFVEITGYRTTAEERGDAFVWIGKGKGWANIKGANWRRPSGLGSSIRMKSDHPVVQVSWLDAQACCDWFGLQLPTEHEWEKAARGDEDDRVWPWGNTAPTDRQCNFDRTVGSTTPVGSYCPSGDSLFGCADIAGNVWEWTNSWYNDDQFERVRRGGSWFFPESYTRVSFREALAPDDCALDLGFRVSVPADFDW